MTTSPLPRSRALLAGALALVTIGALAGCSPEASSTDKPGDRGPVELRLLAQAEIAPPFHTITDQFTAEFPDVTFVVEEVPGASYGEVLKTQLLGGSAADLLFVAGGSGLPEAVLPLAAAGYLAPLTGTPGADLIPEAAQTLFDSDGDIFAQPIDQVPWVNVVNETAFEESGLATPADLDDVIDNCSTATAAGKSLINLAAASVINPANAALQISASRVYSQTPDWNEQRAAGDVTFAGDSGWERTLETFVDLKDAGCFQAGVEAGTPADIAKQVSSGSSVSFLSVGSTISTIAGLNPAATFSAQVFPGDDADDTRLFVSPTNALAINAGSSEAAQSAARDFLAWLAEPANSDAYAELSGNISITKTPDSELPAHYAALAPFIADDLTQPVASAFWPNSEVYSALGSGVQGLLTGQLTVDAVLSSMDSAWDR